MYPLYFNPEDKKSEPEPAAVPEAKAATSTAGVAAAEEKTEPDEPERPETPYAFVCVLRLVSSVY